ncbi:hypothetical protein [Salisaeta longa]|uniref:hypothetical protein n=1 Tax=Salisaeta longa TaxID=503170 RepID=UPI0003B4ED92|nr:hypothetical protein [Salisaeta longa]
MKYDWTPHEAWSTTGAVVLGSTAVFVAFTLFCTLALPVARATALAVGILGGLPLWVAAMAYALLSDGPLRTWGGLLGACAVLLGLSACAHFLL